ncbi:MAG: hypothetical protein ABIJ08_00615, partial [Nanoarchaeota archaeon]
SEFLSATQRDISSYVSDLGETPVKTEERIAAKVDLGQPRPADICLENEGRLSIDADELKSIDEANLVDRIAAHYHSVLPLEINGGKIELEKRYSYEDVSTITGIKKEVLHQMKFNKQITTEKGVLSGYEMLRLYHRLSGNSNTLKGELYERLCISQEIGERLFELGVLQTGFKKDEYASAQTASALYARVFPMLGSPRFNELVENGVLKPIELIPDSPRIRRGSAPKKGSEPAKDGDGYEIPTPAKTDGVLDIDMMELFGLDGDGIIHRITENYHKNRPSEVVLGASGGTVTIEDRGLYDYDTVSRAIGLKKVEIIKLVKDGLIYAKGNNVSGYEILRINNRSRFEGKEIDLDHFCRELLITRDIAYRLANMGKLVRAKSTDYVIDPDSAKCLFDRIYPIQGSEEYDGLVSKKLVKPVVYATEAKALVYVPDCTEAESGCCAVSENVTSLPVPIVKLTGNVIAADQTVPEIKSPAPDLEVTIDQVVAAGDVAKPVENPGKNDYVVDKGIPPAATGSAELLVPITSTDDAGAIVNDASAVGGNMLKPEYIVENIRSLPVESTHIEPAEPPKPEPADSSPQRIYLFTQRGGKAADSSYTGLSKSNLRQNEFDLITDVEQQYEDAFRVRYIGADTGQSHRPTDSFLVNPDDQTRILMVRQYIPESTFRSGMIKELGEYEREATMEALARIGMLPILYKEKIHYAPGSLELTLEIMTGEISDEEKIRAIVDEHGPFIGVNIAGKVFEGSIVLGEFSQATKKEAISSIEVKNKRLYNAAQLYMNRQKFMRV